MIALEIINLTITCGPSVPVIVSAIAPDSPVAAVNVGPIVTQLVPAPEYTFNWLLAVSHHKSPIIALVGSVKLLVLELTFFQIGVPGAVAAFTFKIALVVSHHSCPGNGLLGPDPDAKCSNNWIKFSFKKVPYPG